jgi:hypothetical protein
MHIVQNKDYVILIMYNQSNAITCLKHRAKFIFKNKIVLLYFKNM